MVTWITFNNHFLEVGLTQNQDTMALRMHSGWPLDTFFWAHNFMVTALSLCVKWPFVFVPFNIYLHSQLRNITLAASELQVVLGKNEVLI